ncbi:sulfatase-like hydrolase/transferase [Ponticoccus litoralis]|uniref:Sulfatase-like hydrolase/transferase n=1 Tax=Ponticoccus litoralis TaxID=422297 RepID=A0AAW9SF38_9RHOB
MSQPNFIVICSDQQRWDALGAASAHVDTPNLDRLAARGTRFSTCYCASPICVSSRASIATGFDVHRTRCWSSAQPYTGIPDSWHHALRDAGYRTVSVGKLHYRSQDDDNGFVEEIMPTHVIDGKGYPFVMLRPDAKKMDGIEDFVDSVGWGDSDYTRHDEAVARRAGEWLAAHGDEGPWSMFVSFVTPHHPLIVPERFRDAYPPDRVPLPDTYVAPPDKHPSVQAHPATAGLEGNLHYARFFRDEAHVRELRTYYMALTSFLDECVGRVLDGLEAAGRLDDTVVLFTSDHGEMLGDLGLWTKSYMYEGSVRVPLIAAGPGFPSGIVSEATCSHLDIHATALRAAGLALDETRTGRALQDAAGLVAPDDRSVISGYHDYGSITGTTMLRWKSWKYVHHAGLAPQLFDLAADPTEIHDLVPGGQHQHIVAACAEEMRRHVDPDLASAQAFEDQHALIEALGGREAILNAADLPAVTPMAKG